HAAAARPDPPGAAGGKARLARGTGTSKEGSSTDACSIGGAPIDSRGRTATSNRRHRVTGKTVGMYDGHIGKSIEYFELVYQCWGLSGADHRTLIMKAQPLDGTREPH